MGRGRVTKIVVYVCVLVCFINQPRRSCLDEYLSMYMYVYMGCVSNKKSVVSRENRALFPTAFCSSMVIVKISLVGFSMDAYALASKRINGGLNQII